MPLFQELFLFVMNTVIGFLGCLFLLRFAMQWRRISFANPLGGFTLKLTNWAVLPLRRVIPGLGGLDWASLAAVFLLFLLYYAFLVAIGWSLFLCVTFCPKPSGALILWLAFLMLTRAAIHLCVALILLEVLFSWINPHHPLAQPLRALTGGFLAPIRRLIPPISGIDLSPLVALLILQILLIVLSRL